VTALAEQVACGERVFLRDAQPALHVSKAYCRTVELSNPAQGPPCKSGEGVAGRLQGLCLAKPANV
jgi:hypothetical protein